MEDNHYHDAAEFKPFLLDPKAQCCPRCYVETFAHYLYCPGCGHSFKENGNISGIDPAKPGSDRHLSGVVIPTATYERLVRVESAAEEDVKVACELCPIGSMPDPENCGICSVLDLWRALEGKEA
jgi:hypothetical protein